MVHYIVKLQRFKRSDPSAIVLKEEKHKHLLYLHNSMKGIASKLALQLQQPTLFANCLGLFDDITSLASNIYFPAKYQQSQLIKNSNQQKH